MRHRLSAFSWESFQRRAALRAWNGVPHPPLRGDFPTAVGKQGETALRVWMASPAFNFQLDELSEGNGAARMNSA